MTLNYSSMFLIGRGRLRFWLLPKAFFSLILPELPLKLPASPGKINSSSRNISSLRPLEINRSIDQFEIKLVFLNSRRRPGIVTDTTYYNN